VTRKVIVEYSEGDGWLILDVGTVHFYYEDEDSTPAAVTHDIKREGARHFGILMAAELGEPDP
jgi:hypothetical protein